MGLKFALPLPDPAALKDVGGKLRAWWNGEDPPAAAAVEAVAEAPGARDAGPPPDPVKLAICAGEALWGEGRVEPGSEALDVRMAGAVAATKGSRLAVFALGAGATALAISRTCLAKVDAHVRAPDWKTLIEDAAKEAKQSKLVTAELHDATPGSVRKNRADGALFLWRGVSREELEAHVFMAERVLKPGKVALWVDLFARRDDESLDACRGPEGRSFSTEDDFTSLLAPAGLTLRGEEDWTPDVLNLVQAAWSGLQADWDARFALLVKTGGQPAAQAALEQVLLWKARADALRRGKLAARRYLLAPV